MTELDFDELDKAVNNLMGDIGADKSTTVPVSDDDIKVSIIPPAVTAPATQPASMPDQQPAPASEESAVRVSVPAARPLAVKRRGRFMDVVHPSSDMKTTGSPVSKREGVSIEPRDATVVPERTDAEAAKSDAVNYDFAAAFDMESTKPADQPALVEAEQVATVKSEWPDPIEFTKSHDEQQVEALVEETPSSTDVPADVLDEVAKPSVEQPLTSPFLSDAKVEKRPLGGGATPLAEESTNEEPDAESDEQVAAMPHTLPDELQTDVMALESSDTSTAPKVEEKVASAAELPEEKPVNTSDDAAQAAQPSAGGAIAQQYAEQPSTSDQTSGSIYDTATYHQPLEHPEKRKSSWTLIIWILLLLIAGAAAGAAYFYFTTQA